MRGCNRKSVRSRVAQLRPLVWPRTWDAGCGASQRTRSLVVDRCRGISRICDASFLSRIMGRTVTSVSVIGGDAGTSSRARLALAGDDVPASVFVKMPA